MGSSMRRRCENRTVVKPPRPTALIAPTGAHRYFATPPKSAAKCFGSSNTVFTNPPHTRFTSANCGLCCWLTYEANRTPLKRNFFWLDVPATTLLGWIIHRRKAPKDLGLFFLGRRLFSGLPTSEHNADAISRNIPARFTSIKVFLVDDCCDLLKVAFHNEPVKKLH